MTLSEKLQLTADWWINDYDNAKNGEYADEIETYLNNEWDIPLVFGFDSWEQTQSVHCLVCLFVAEAIK